MITRKTVLVLGAGASRPFGFPSGQLLLDIIRYFLNYPRRKGIRIDSWLPSEFELPLGESFRMLKDYFAEKSLDALGEKLYTIGEESIDAFLEYQTGDFLKIGKAAIAAVMLAFEREASLYEDFMNQRLKTAFLEGREKDGTENNWYQLLWSALSAPFEDFGSNQLKIVTFNYDRSLEHYLFTCLKNKYPDKKGSEYKKLICPIVHIHGSLGPLSWQDPYILDNEPEPLFVPYDIMYKKETAKVTTSDIWSMRRNAFKVARRNITVIHENENDTPELNTARDWINDSDRLIFMGFGYHQTNVERLKIREHVDKNTEILGTTYGLSLDRYQYARSLFASCKGSWSSDIEHQTLISENIYTFLHDKIVLT